MDVSPSPVLDAEQRAWRYWFVDGLTNLVVGVSALLFALCMLYPPHWPPAPLSVAVWLIALGLYVALGVRHREIVEWLKTKTTYPRTGYVPSPEDTTRPADLVALSLQGTPPAEEALRLYLGRRRRMALTIALVLLAIFGTMAIGERWVWSAAGVVVGVAMWIARKDYRLSWIVVLGFPFIGVSMTIFLASRMNGPAYFLAGWGVLFLFDGVITLIRYIFTNPVARGREA